MKQIIKIFIIIIVAIIIGSLVFIYYQTTNNNSDNCAKQGENINEPPGNSEHLLDECCEGLKGLGMFSISDSAECQQLKGGPFLTCLPCGNGVCDEHENGCNCPEDCNCAGKGEFANPPNLSWETDYSDTCCLGLKGVMGYKVAENGECEGITGTPYLTCVPCGDGICEEIGPWFENKCNCPEDCS